MNRCERDALSSVEITTVSPPSRRVASDLLTAESFTANADSTEWTFKLRPNIKFGDGYQRIVVTVNAGGYSSAISATTIDLGAGDSLVTVNLGNGSAGAADAEFADALDAGEAEADFVADGREVRA